MDNRKAPPYSRNLFALQAKGFAPTLHVSIFIGTHAMERAGAQVCDFPCSTLALKPWLPPTDFKWPVRDCVILVIQAGYNDPLPEYITALINVLFHDGARIVHVHLTDSFITYHKEVPE